MSYGLDVFDASGDVVFSSSLKAMTVIERFTITPSSPGSRNYPAGTVLATTVDNMLVDAGPNNFTPYEGYPSVVITGNQVSWSWVGFRNGWFVTSADIVVYAI